VARPPSRIDASAAPVKKAAQSERTPASGLQVTRRLIYALIPGSLVFTAYFGAGVLTNVLVACFWALVFEFLALLLTSQSPSFARVSPGSDPALLIPGWLIALGLPPGSPWWLLAVASGTAVLLGKHAFGGTRNSPVNPAMLGYAVVLLCYPAMLSSWPAPSGVEFSMRSWLATAIWTLAGPDVDAITMATPLDLLRHNSGYLMADLFNASPQLGAAGGVGWQEANAAFLLGGIALLRYRLITWHIPGALLLSLTVLAALFYDEGSSTSGGSPFFHLLSGGTMLAAFFIATEPNTSPRNARGKLLFGALVGALIFLIRTCGDYPDGVAWAVLLANLCAPTIERLTDPIIQESVSARDEAR
ncbi:MAG: RnfABCDGE type electron transport complex subunit D, partial [Pseudomonadota bacterium]